MRRLNWDTAELLAQNLRSRLGMSYSEPVNVKTVLRQLNILTVYRPMSEKIYGLSLKSRSGNDLFILVNSNSTRGRQHFTIAHELYHLIYGENPQPHFCEQGEQRNATEKNADMFASALLMPREGVIKATTGAIATGEMSIETVLGLGQLFAVSHSTLVLRLKELKIITPQVAEQLLGVSVMREALMRGMDLSLYRGGNENLIIGDFGSIAKRLYDSEKISEGHYNELLNMIGYGEG